MNALPDRPIIRPKPGVPARDGRAGTVWAVSSRVAPPARPDVAGTVDVIG